MVTFRYGGKNGLSYRLREKKQLMVVRTHSQMLPQNSPLSARARAAVDDLVPVVSLPAAGVQVLSSGSSATAPIRKARAALKDEKDVRFVGAALSEPNSGAAVIYTENAFVKFHDQVPETRCQRFLKAHKLEIRRELTVAQSAYFVAAPEGIGQKIFDLTLDLLKREEVELCHPELARKRAFRAAFSQQWHLQETTVNQHVIKAHANVANAWASAQGAGAVIAVIDDGFDLLHEEFQSAGKIVAPRDVTRNTSDPSPGSGDMHGHACAGVACADGLHGASGVAPRATLIPIRLESALGSQDEADAFVWAADHGADVISCSWGPEDGKWWDSTDPLHLQVVPLPDSTRLAIEYAITNGRGGKGCVIVWAAGNGNESVDHDGYASYAKVIAVAACNDKGKRSAYSDKGKAVWCSFPSNDGVTSLTPGIWTTDLSGASGYNPGKAVKGDTAGNYTNSFGGTSSAAPGAAGVAALVLSKNQNLRWNDVRDIFKRCCDRIDPAGGHYDGSHHSKKYGYGRLNAATAVQLA